MIVPWAILVGAALGVAVGINWPLRRSASGQLYTHRRWPRRKGAA